MHNCNDLRFQGCSYFYISWLQYVLINITDLYIQCAPVGKLIEIETEIYFPPAVLSHVINDIVALFFTPRFWFSRWTSGIFLRKCQESLHNCWFLRKFIFSKCQSISDYAPILKLLILVSITRVSVPVPSCIGCIVGRTTGQTLTNSVIFYGRFRDSR